MKNIKEIVAENLVLLRKANGLTQIDLSKKINYSDKAISRWEKGEISPDIETLDSICKVYGVHVSYLLEEHENQEKIEKQKTVNINALMILSVAVVWTLFTVLFVFIKTNSNTTFWQAFVWAVPSSCITLGVLNQKFLKSKKLGICVSSVLCWTLITALYLQLLQYNLYLLFIIGAPIQVCIIMSYYLTH